MTNGLQKLGTTMFKLKWWTVLFWTVVIAALSVVMLQVGPKTTDSLSIPGTQAQQTLDRFGELFPDAGASSAKVVVAAPEGKKVADYNDAITVLTKDIAQVNEVTTAVSPFDLEGSISKDGTIAFITVQLKPEGDHVSTKTIEAIDALMETTSKSGLTVVAGGDLLSAQLGEILGVGEVIGVVVALIVLVITLGSLIAAGMPIIIAIVTVGASMAGLFALSNTIEITNTAPVLAVMLGLAVGIDYSLFIVNRYRTFVKDGFSYRDAAGRAIATAGNAVIFAAATVVIALAALSVVQIPFMTTMGLAAAATVALAALVAVTLIPSLLGIAGSHVFSRKERDAIRRAQKEKTGPVGMPVEKTVWFRLGERIIKYRLPIFIVSILAIVVLALPMNQLRLGLPTAETAAEGSSARQSYDLLAKGFGAGYNSPLVVVVENAPLPTDADKDALRTRIAKQYQQQAGVTAETMQLMPSEMQQQMMAKLEQQVTAYLPYYSLQQIAERVAKLDNVSGAQAVLVADDGTKGVIQVIPSTGPSDEATKQLVEALRSDTTQQTLANGSKATFAVTGTTALQIDVDTKLADALPVYLGVVVGLSFIILLVAFRSILIPIKATLGFLLSVFAMFGALVAVFQWGWLGIAEAPSPIVSFIPIIATGILFGLAMDYEFFLVSSMQESYHHGKKPKGAVIHGFAIGSRVVVAAGLIMVAVFAGFITNHDATIQSIGFALAVGVLVDAFIVRMVIVPIVMSYLGKAAWWIPKWLDKVLPKISIEGDESALK